MPSTLGGVHCPCPGGPIGRAAPLSPDHPPPAPSLLAFQGETNHDIPSERKSPQLLPQDLERFGQSTDGGQRCAALRTAHRPSFRRLVIFHRCFPSAHVFGRQVGCSHRSPNLPLPLPTQAGMAVPPQVTQSHPAEARCPPSPPRPLSRSPGAPAALHARLGFTPHSGRRSRDSPRAPGTWSTLEVIPGNWGDQHVALQHGGFAGAPADIPRDAGGTLQWCPCSRHPRPSSAQL